MKLFGFIDDDYNIAYTKSYTKIGKWSHTMYRIIRVCVEPHVQHTYKLIKIYT